MAETQSVRIQKLSNGVTLVGERMEYVSSLAMSILIPVGAATDPDGLEGAASVLAEKLNKGAGPYGNKELSEELEKYGIHHSNSAGIEVSVTSAALLGENRREAIRLLGNILLEPRFPEEELESVRQLALQELKSLEDEPSSKVMVELAKVFYPAPFGRSQLGTEEGLRKVDIAALRRYYGAYYVPNNVIIGVAGAFDWDELVREIEDTFGGWRGSQTLLETKPFRSQSLVQHIAKDSSQEQLALAYPSVSLDHPDYYAARLAVGVLSGGMSGRLFIEVREKRGLVYRVSASHSAARGRAAVLCYAGTTPERCEEITP